MAINVKCSSCGTVYNELTNAKCPNCGSEQIINLKYEGEELVEVDSSIMNDDAECENYQNRDTEDYDYIPQTPFPYTEVPVIFSGVYEWLFKKDEKIKYQKLLLIVLFELAIGIAIATIGYYISLGMEERAHDLGISNRGGSKGGTMLMFMGVAAIAHSFYSLVKYTVLYFIGKMKVKKNELWTRLCLFSVEMVIGAIFIIIAVLTDSNYSGPYYKVKDLVFVLSGLGAGLGIGAIWSLAKYFIRKRVNNEI